MQNQNKKQNKKQKDYPKVNWNMIPPYVISWDGKVYEIIPLSKDGNRCDFVEISDVSKFFIDYQEYLQKFGPRKFKIKAGGYENMIEKAKEEDE